MRIPRGLKKRLEDSLGNLSPKEAARLHQIYLQEAARKGIDADDYSPRLELLAAWDQRLARSRGRPEEPQVVADFNAWVYLRNVAHATNQVLSDLSLAVAFDAFRAASGLTLLLYQDAMTEAIRGFKNQVAEATPRPVSIEDYDRLLAWLKTDALETLSGAAETLFYAKREGDEAEADLDQLFDDLVAKFDAGELVGGQGIAATELDRPVLIEEGKVPAWAALRLVWRNFVRSRGLRIYDDADRATWSPDPVDRIGRDGEGLTDKELRDLVADFYRDCRRRPWGKGLAPKADPGDLVKLLTQSANPFLHLKPFDFGRVDWEAFAASETDWRGDPFEAEPVATIASLDALDESFRRGETFAAVNYYRSRYFPAADPEDQRAELARVLARFSRLETTRQPFTFDRAEEGEYSLSELMGFQFVTPFEQAFENLRKTKAYLLSLHQAEKEIGDRYFGGLPILLESSPLMEPLSHAEGYFESATVTLSAWLKQLSDWPWKIDVSHYSVDDVEPDEEITKTIVERVLDEARSRGRFSAADAAAVERSLGGS